MEIFHQIKSDPLRTFLSLFGVSVGIFVVVVSFALVDGFKRAVVAGFDHFGSDMIMVERFPVVEESSGDGAGNDDGGGDADWSRYAARPQPSKEDFLALAGQSTSTMAWSAIAAEAEADISYSGKIMRGCKLVGVRGAWQHLIYSSVCEGRDFSMAELSGADTKVIIGAKIADGLSGQSSSSTLCGSTVRIDGRNMTVVGILSEEGKNIINLYASDYALFVPFAAAENIAGDGALETMIAAGPGSASREAAMGEMRRTLRAARRLSPAQEDNFALNTMEDLCRQTVSLTRKITVLGLAVALFSLLIGGFGIVNIMFVSVKERTWSIGLKKALGARRNRILLEFLLEALILSVLGAALGLLLAWGVVALIPSGVVDANITSAHIALAFALACTLGLASGLAPAAQASRLNPVDALRK
ncbi:MAG: ABC transporter permease [Bacteroidales bacterium]|nr:ABC transporter permease [Bacteroidales bacterium]